MYCLRGCAFCCTVHLKAGNNFCLLSKSGDACSSLLRATNHSIPSSHSGAFSLKVENCVLRGVDTGNWCQQIFRYCPWTTTDTKSTVTASPLTCFVVLTSC
ncbi:hypothetical protein IscW_ISCW007049 [Ixodes scapularis]|uniref:Uncharacterized protein n=1 Tax=Ixodes scapularis TaxID=6945 RepID=B7PU81_IXOSC|nr:hypothetical protein IscW_ISCW007049 [Ixodes scapularis]|eukprot:XP_002405630.1 hypothetical protein IscW_ISCW007049 [Ixodes scapularis]